MKSESARTYGSRARGVIKEFLRWDADALAYRPKAARALGRPEKKSEESAKKKPAPLVRLTPIVHSPLVLATP